MRLASQKGLGKMSLSGGPNIQRHDYRSTERAREETRCDHLSVEAYSNKEVLSICHLGDELLKGIDASDRKMPHSRNVEASLPGAIPGAQDDVDGERSFWTSGCVGRLRDQRLTRTPRGCRVPLGLPGLNRFLAFYL